MKLIFIAVFGLVLGACGSASQDQLTDEDLAQTSAPDGAATETAIEAEVDDTLDGEALASPEMAASGGGAYSYAGGGYESFDRAEGEGEQVQPAREFDEYSARRDAEREVARRGYRGYCTSDCGGHDAGFQWAADNRLKSPGYTGDSPSFDEGQEEYTKGVKKALEEKREEFESDPASSDYAE